MQFELDASDFDPEDIGGQEQVMGGAYHALITDVNEDPANGNLKFELQILRGTTPGQEDKMYTLSLKREFAKWPMRKLSAMAIAARLTTVEAINAAKSGTGPKVSPDYSQAKGRSICIQLERKPDQNTGTEWTNLVWDNIWKPEDKRANHIPLHKGVIDREGVKLLANRPIDGVLAKQPPAKSNEPKPNNSAQSSGSTPDMSSVL